MVVHVIGFFVSLIVLWVTSEHAPARQVFTEFQDNGGWGNTGLSALVGITTPLWSFLGPDAGAHMSEELKDASRVLPSAMMWGSLFNALLGLVMLITLCFCLGPDWQDNVLGFTNPTQTGIPIIQVLYNSTNSIAATTFMTTILILLSMVGTITCIASSSRQVWAFARDKGFPFSSYIEYVSHFSVWSALSHGRLDSALIPYKGTAWMGHTRQLNPRSPCHLPTHLRAQLRLRRRPERHHQPLQRGPPLLIHTIHWIHPIEAPPQPRAATSPLVIGQVGFCDQ